MRLAIRFQRNIKISGSGTLAYRTSQKAHVFKTWDEWLAGLPVFYVSAYGFGRYVRL